MLSISAERSRPDSCGVFRAQLRWQQSYRVHHDFVGVGLVPTEGQRSRGFELEVAVHPSDLGRIVGIYPGAGGNIDGHKGKYAKLAEHIRTNGIGAVVRCGNPIPEDHGLDVNLRAMLDYCMANAIEIC